MKILLADIENRTKILEYLQELPKLKYDKYR